MGVAADCLSFHDCGYGAQNFENGLEPEFVVWRNDDWPSYQLAVVVDDHDQGITEVVRGRDLLDSTPRQLSIYAALSWPAPEFFHIPLCTALDGQKLSKQNLAPSVHEDAVVATLKRALLLLAQDAMWLDASTPARLLQQAAAAWSPLRLQRKCLAEV